MISVLAPSRGRSDAACEMACSARLTAHGPIEVLVYADDDDPTDYGARGCLSVHRGPRITLSDCWNKLADIAEGDILHMGSDDIRFRTQGWDTIVRSRFDVFPDRIAFVFGRDGIHDEKLGTHGFVSREWVDAVGCFTWPTFPADYADTWLDQLAYTIGRRVYVDDLLIEHLHPIAGKAEWDQTHFERLARGRASNVGQMWRELGPERAEAAERLRAALK